MRSMLRTAVKCCEKQEQGRPGDGSGVSDPGRREWPPGEMPFEQRPVKSGRYEIGGGNLLGVFKGPQAAKQCEQLHQVGTSR